MLISGKVMTLITLFVWQYESSGDVEAFAHFLISILDTPEKINLLAEVR